MEEILFETLNQKSMKMLNLTCKGNKCSLEDRKEIVETYMQIQLIIYKLTDDKKLPLILLFSELDRIKKDFKKSLINNYYKRKIEKEKLKK